MYAIRSYYGQYVAEIAKGFGLELYAFDPFVSKDIIKKAGITPLDSVEELYKTCHYVSLHRNNFV